MEKISFPELIAELSEKSALYNQWYNESEMKYGSLPSLVIAAWMTEVVEPIVKATVAQNSAPEKIHEVVKALYQESLKLIGSGQAIRYKKEYKTAWLLMAQMPNLAVKFPVKTISLLNDVLSNFHLYAPEKIIDWCELVQTSSDAIKTIEDFKTIGRIYAWKCGLAHLRIRLKTDYNELSENLKETIVNTIDFPVNTTRIFEQPWTNNHTKFEGVQGGFKGNTGFFEHPPKLAEIDGNIFVTDSKSNYVLFADQFGKVLLPADTVDTSYILSNTKRLETLEKWIGKDNEKIDGSTISSVVATKDTLVFTLQNSYFLYLFSLANA
ncbi:hypothetical protein [Flavobacterium branchiicola]|uniref:Uncharacterized protein n=1 Tax=Flavobacterium branchiicola TaxID=1114875 RepID=A0ABV9PLN3_9FLAO|nr:hypothetical protein [Flavobacterium branchiicola]MBS7256314.1 hypothetical protein [Flavobacterium branchiicola]